MAIAMTVSLLGATSAHAAKKPKARTTSAIVDVLAAPSRSGSVRLVPVLLPDAAARRLGSPLVVRVRVSTKIGSIRFGAVAGQVSTLRSGDRVRFRIRATRTGRGLTLTASKPVGISRTSQLSASQLEAIVTALRADVGRVRTDLNRLTGAIGQGFGLLVARLNGLTTTSVALSSRIDALDARLVSEVARLDRRIDETSGLLGQLGVDDARLQQQLDALSGSLSDVLARLTGQEALTGDLATGLVSLTSQLTSLTSQLGVVGARVDALDAALDAIGGLLGPLAPGQLAQMQAGLAVAQAGLASLASDVSGLHAQTEALSSVVGGAVNGIAALDTRLDVLDAASDDLAATTMALLAGQGDQQTRLDALAAGLLAADGALDGLVGQLPSQQAITTGLTGAVSGLGTRLNAAEGTLGVICAVRLPGLPGLCG